MTNKIRNDRPINSECSHVEALLSEFVDGRLSPDRTWHVQKHLAVCARCSLSVRQTQATLSLLRRMPAQQTGEAFESSLLERIQATRQSRGKAASRYGLMTSLAPVFRFPDLRRSLSPRRLAASLAIPAVCLALGGMIALQRPLQMAPAPPHSVSATQPNINDASLVQKCITDHQSFGTGQPLADPSAQVLAAQVETLPKSVAVSDNFTDQDAAVLLGDGS